jgi:hypothetical protein
MGKPDSADSNTIAAAFYWRDVPIRSPNARQVADSAAIGREIRAKA